MLETLVGRLQWERTNDGIRVEIPGPRNLKAIQNALLMACPWPVGILIVASVFDRFTRLHDPSNTLELVFSFGLAAGTIKLIGMLRSKTILILSPTQMKIESRFSITGWETSFFKTGSIERLQFMNYSSGAVIRYSGGAGRRIDLRLDEIQFTHGSVVFTFAAGITQKEATALIVRMTEVSPFGKSLASA